MEGYMRLPRLFVSSILLSSVLLPAQISSQLSGDQIIERASPAVVLILAGSGDGKVAAIGSGLVVRSEGILLTANHVVKGMKEVQIRLKSGEVYDRVEMIAADERRDIAALRIPATDLPVLPVANFVDVRAGAPVFAVTNGAGLPWTASSGVISAVRSADEVPGAGSGYRLLQFTAPLSPGSSGGVLVDGQARALAIVVGFLSAGQNVNFAIPLDSIVGMASITGGTPFDSGSHLQLPSAGRPGMPSSPGSTSNFPPSVPQLPPADQLQIRTISVYSHTIYLRRERFQDDLRQHPLFRQLGLRFADYQQTADVAITVDRPFLTFDWTYLLVFQPSNLTLATGTIVGDDEFDAGPKLAAAVLEQLAAATVLPRSTLNAAPPASRALEIERSGPTDPAAVLRNSTTIFVESHTIYLKGNLLQDAIYTRPEIRDWGIRVVDDRPSADIYIDVTRPFLTFDWEFKIIDNRTGTILGTGKVVAWDGHIAAPQLAIEIIKIFRGARPLPPPKG
jgi:S1-C subfamily serine protease